MNTPPAPLTYRAALPWLLLTTTVFFCSFVGRTIVSPLMPAIEAELGISHAVAGRFFLYLAVGYVSALQVAGFLSSRVNHRVIISGSAFAMGGCLFLFAWADSLLLISTALFCYGAACGFYFPSGVAAMTSLTARKNWGKALSIHELAPNVALTSSPILAEIFLRYADWRTALVSTGLFCVGVGVVYALIGRGGHFHGERPNPSLYLLLIKRGDLWILALLLFLAASSSFGVYSILPLYLIEERGLGHTHANTLMAASRILSPFVALASGAIADRFGALRTLAVCVAVGGLATVALGLGPTHLLDAIVVVQALITVAYFPPLFATVSARFPAGLRPVAMSLVVTCGVFGGMGVAPTLLGILGDTVGFAPGIVGFGLAFALGAPMLARLGPPPVDHDHPAG